MSPTEESYYESLCSLRFAAQVNQCELGKPKRQVKDAASSSCATPKAAAVPTNHPPKVAGRLRAAPVASVANKKLKTTM